MKELVPMTYQNQKCDQKAISRSQLVYTFRTGTSIPMGKIENVAVKKENAEVRFSLPRRQAEVIDLTKSPPKRRPTTSHSIRVRKSKIPKPPPPTARRSRVRGTPPLKSRATFYANFRLSYIFKEMFFVSCRVLKVTC